MKLRISSDGTAGGTTVVDADTEEDITHLVRAIRWTLEAGRNPQVEITLAKVDAEVHIEVA